MPIFDVIVVGGGVAGLAAAGALGRAGKRVLLLEARDRLGGRILTARPRGWDAPVELGAEFVHAGNRALWRFLKKHRIATRGVLHRDWLFHDEHLREVDNMAERIERVTDEIDGRRMRGWSFADFMRGRRDAFDVVERNLASNFVEGFQAALPERMSAPALEGETLDEAEQFVVPHGYDRVVEALCRELVPKRVTVLCGTPVTRIRWRRGEVQVTAGRRVWTAPAALVTLPLGVWQAPANARGAVHFEPPLRAKAKLARRMGLGHVVRIQIRFDGRRWRGLLPETLRRASRRGFGFLHSRIEGVPVWWALSGRPVVTGWAGGPAALQLRGRSSPAICDVATGALAKLLGRSRRDVRAAVADWRLHNWSRDPFARGAYSFTAAGQEDAADRLRQPVQGTLFFAGEATADGAEVGTVHGALASGLRAAEEVRAVLTTRANG